MTPPARHLLAALVDMKRLFPEQGYPAGYRMAVSDWDLLRDLITDAQTLLSPDALDLTEDNSAERGRRDALRHEAGLD